MRRFIGVFFLVLLALVVLSPATVAVAGPTGSVTTCDMPGVGGSESPDTVIGALAAVGCGLFWRATIVTAGTQVGTIVGAVACCGYMVCEAFMVVHK